MLQDSTETSRALDCTVGVAAIAAPALHSLTDVLEWRGHGFSPLQLWLNYAAFLPMPWLLLGIYAVQPRKAGLVGVAGALLYGAAFTYFSYTTLYALSEHVANYELLWQRLGSTYTVHGAAMIVGGLLFGFAALRARAPSKLAVQMFVAGILVNLIVGLLPAPALLQTVGSALRNLGLMAMGYEILARRPVT